MFARPKSSGRVKPRQNNSAVEHTFTKIIGPAISKSTLSSCNSTTTTSTSSTVRSDRTGDGQSFTYNHNDPVNLDKRTCQRGYRILSYKEDRSGRKIVFDLLDGTVYNCGAGMGKKLTSNGIIFDSKKSALSERFPSNQFGASQRSGNGIYPKVLVAFDGWGQCRRRLGGGPSTQYEFVKFIGIVEFLDAHYPIANRMCDGYVEPHYFTKSDRYPPNRMMAERAQKVDRSFEPKGYTNCLF